MASGRRKTNQISSVRAFLPPHRQLHCVREARPRLVGPTCTAPQQLLHLELTPIDGLSAEKDRPQRHPRDTLPKLVPEPVTSTEEPDFRSQVVVAATAKIVDSDVQRQFSARERLSSSTTDVADPVPVLNPRPPSPSRLPSGTPSGRSQQPPPVQELQGHGNPLPLSFRRRPSVEVRIPAIEASGSEPLNGG